MGATRRRDGRRVRALVAVPLLAAPLVAAAPCAQARRDAAGVGRVRRRHAVRVALGGGRRRRPLLVVRSPLGRPRRCLRPDRRARLAAGAGRPLRAAREPRGGKTWFLSPNRRSRGHALRGTRPHSAVSSGIIPSYSRGAIEQLHNAALPPRGGLLLPRRLERTAAALAAATRCSAQSHSLLTALQRLPAARGARQCACDSRLADCLAAVELVMSSCHI